MKFDHAVYVVQDDEASGYYCHFDDFVEAIKDAHKTGIKTVTREVYCVTKDSPVRREHILVAPIYEILRLTGDYE